MLKTFFALVMFTSAQATENKPGTVTIPVDEYIQLREAKKGPELTTVESLNFEGVFGKSLTMTVSGSASGAPKSVDILQRSDVFGVKDCSGTNAMLSGNENRLHVVPLQAGRFKISCTVQIRNWAQTEFTVDNVLYAGARVSGGEALIRAEGSSQVITLVRPSAPSEDTKAPLAVVARYRVTVLPEESRFQYEFQISNPNRTLRRLTVPKTNGEIFGQIRTTIQHQETPEGLALDLQPGENVVRAEGRFAGSAFAPPVEGQSFLLVENSPSLQLTIEGQSRRIAPSDAGISPRFAGARAFLLTKDQKIAWEARKLEVFSALGYSVKWANYVFYVPRRGTPIVEATFQINNQGTPEVALEVPGQVTYLEVGGQPQVLSRDKDGKLLLQLPGGEQNVLVQYLSKTEHGSLLAIPRERLARPAAVLSNVNLSLSLDPRWSLAFGRSLFEIDSDLSFADLVWAALAALLAYWLAITVGLSRRDRLLFSGGTFLALAASPPLFLWVMLAFGLYMAVRHRITLRRQWPATFIGRAVAVGGGSIALFLLLVALMNSPLFRGSAPMRFASEQMYNKMENLDASVGSFRGGSEPGAVPPPAPKEARSEGALEQEDMSLGGAGDYQGVPARLAIPEGRVISFSQGVIDAKTPVKMSAILINRAAGAVLMVLALLAAAHALYHNRRKFREGLRL